MRFLRNRIWVLTQVCIWTVAVAGCSSEEGSGNEGGAPPSFPAVTTGGAGGSGGPPAQPGQEGSGLTGTGAAPGDPAPGAAGMPPLPPTSGSGSPPDGQPPPADPVAPPADPVAPPADPVAPPADPVAPPADPVAPPADPVAPPADPVAPPDNGAAGGPASPDPIPPLQPAGPDDGDPNRPIVEVPGVACGPNPSLFGLTATNVEIGGRGVYVAYPCNKHGGAPVTFVLNLHGTMPTEELKLYQVAYFSINSHVDTHNIITAAPKAIGSQWGNGDGGLDEPHLLEVIDWVYTTFAEFDIRAMWVGGHSWGGMYTSRFGCNPAIADKVKGIIPMSGGGVGGFGGAACADRVSAIITTAEGDGRRPSDQAVVAAGHGCDAAQNEMILNNEHTVWPNCDPHFVHANFYMLGKEHATYMDAEVVQRIADLINAGRP